jgi:hypothetical protein
MCVSVIWFFCLLLILCYIECHREQLEVGLVAVLMLGEAMVATIVMQRNQMQRLSRATITEPMGVNIQWWWTWWSRNEAKRTIITECWWLSRYWDTNGNIILANYYGEVYGSFGVVITQESFLLHSSLKAGGEESVQPITLFMASLLGSSLCNNSLVDITQNTNRKCTSH